MVCVYVSRCHYAVLLSLAKTITLAFFPQDCIFHILCSYNNNYNHYWLVLFYCLGFIPLLVTLAEYRSDRGIGKSNLQAVSFQSTQNFEEFENKKPWDITKQGALFFACAKLAIFKATKKEIDILNAKCLYSLFCPNLLGCLLLIFKRSQTSNCLGVK